MITNDFIGSGKFKVAVIGSRTITDKKLVFDFLDSKIEKIGLVISGGCKGIDLISEEYCRSRGIPFLVFPAKWKDKNGNLDRGAGFSRNVLIVKESDVVIAFQANKSKGTQHSIDLAIRYGKELKVIEC